MMDDEYDNWADEGCDLIHALVGKEIVCSACPLDKCVHHIFDNATEEFLGVIAALKLGLPYDYGCPKCHSKGEWAYINDDSDFSCVHCGYIIYKHKAIGKVKNGRSLK